MNFSKGKLLLLKKNINLLSFSSMAFIFSIVVGVGSVTGINSYKNNLKSTIIKESRKIMGSDLSFDSSTELSPEIIREIETGIPEGSKLLDVVQFASMLGISKTGDTTLSMIKGMDVGFPFYGKIITEPPDAYETLKNNEILLDETIVSKYNIEIGDSIQLGDKAFKFMGSIQKEPISGMSGFAGMAPTSIVKFEDIQSTGLTKKGSRIKYSKLASIPDTVDTLELKKSIFYKFANLDITVLHHTEVGSGTQKFIYNTMEYMGLLGMASFFLGAISILITVRTRLQSKNKEIAIVKCLGADSLFSIQLFISEILILSTIGSILGLFFGYTIQFIIPDITGSEFLSQIKPTLDLKSIIWGFLIGILVPLSLTIESIYSISIQSPLSAIRSEIDSNTNLTFKSKLVSILQIITLYTLFFIITSLETGKLSKGIILSLTLILLPLLIYSLYILLRRFGKKLSELNLFSGTTKFLISKISNSGNDLSLPIVGISSALSILLLSLFLRNSLFYLSGWEFEKVKANIFVMDIKPENKSNFESIINSFDIKEKYISPMIGARLKSINSIPIKKEDQDINALERDWKNTAKTREYFLSIRDHLYDTEQVHAGSFWKPGVKNEISVEKDFAKSLGVKVGDTLEFTIQGIGISGKITNTREVNWADMKPNFVVIFSGGDLESAPANYISSFYIESKSDKYSLQKKLSSTFPGLTIFDIEKTLSALNSIFTKVNSIIDLMTYFIISASLLLLLSSLYLQEKARKQETALYKIVGANSNFIYKIYSLEALVVTIYSFFSGLALSLLSNYLISTEILNLPFKIPIINIFLVFLLSFILVQGIYFISIIRIISIPPKKYLYSE